MSAGKSASVLSPLSHTHTNPRLIRDQLAPQSRLGFPQQQVPTRSFKKDIWRVKREKAVMAGMLPRLPAMRTREPFSGNQGRLSLDATRELTKCANGDIVSHEIVRDGIDALLQLKRASYSTTASENY